MPKSTKKMDNNQNIPPESDRQKAISLYRQGADAWQRGDRATAIRLYNESVALDPKGPGKTALEMTTDIMDFYDKQQFNP